MTKDQIKKAKTLLSMFTELDSETIKVWTPEQIEAVQFISDLPNEENDSEMYYVRNKGYLGNALLWWKKDCKGYTCDIRDAEKFTKDEAEKICKRPQDTAYRCEYIDGLTVSHKLIVDSQYVESKEQLFRN